MSSVEDICQLYQAGLMTFYMRAFWLDCCPNSHCQIYNLSALKHRSSLQIPASHSCRHPKIRLSGAAIPRVDPATNSSSWVFGNKYFTSNLPDLLLIVPPDLTSDSKKHAEIAFRSCRLLAWILSGCWESSIAKSYKTSSSFYSHYFKKWHYFVEPTWAFQAQIGCTSRHAVSKWSWVDLSFGRDTGVSILGMEVFFVAVL